MLAIDLRDKRALVAGVAGVAGFGEFLSRTDNPYAGPGAEKMWPAYVMDKYIVGLIDAWRLSAGHTFLRLQLHPKSGSLDTMSEDDEGDLDPPSCEPPRVDGWMVIVRCEVDTGEAVGQEVW